MQFFSLCLWAPPMILLTAGALTDPQLPARASNVYTTDARLGGIDRVAPQTKILATPVLLEHFYKSVRRIILHCPSIAKSTCYRSKISAANRQFSACEELYSQYFASQSGYIPQQIRVETINLKRQRVEITVHRRSEKSSFPFS